MNSVRIETIAVGMIETNCYLAANTETAEAFVVDPGGEAKKLIRRIDASGCSLCGILLTHGHFDHILAAGELRAHYQVPVYALAEEAALLADPVDNLSADYDRDCSLRADIWLHDEERFTLAGLQIRTIHTPGHTKGSCCFELPDEGILFSGDTLFRRGAGRTDFPGGDVRELTQSLQRLVHDLPGKTLVFPGHDAATTIEEEARYNPFV